MGWNVKFGDKIVDLDDLSPDVFQKIADDEDADASWYDVYLSPGARVDRLWHLICAAADKAAVDRPEKPPTIKAELALIEMLEKTTDIQDRAFQDGFPPMPPVPETSFTSGARGDTDGLPTSSADNQSVNS